MFDSIASSLQTQPKPVFRFNARNSFITSQLAQINGFQVGLHYKGGVEIGLGYNWLRGGIKKSFMVDSSTKMLPLKFRFISGYFEYTFYSARYWQLSIPLQFGIGTSFYKDATTRRNAAPVVLYEPGMVGAFRPFRFVGFGAGIGYRLMLLNNRAIAERFTSPIYMLKIHLYFGEMYRAAKRLNS